MYDLIIRNGLVVDGTGSPAKSADIAVKDGLIAALGNVESSGSAATKEIDANGLLVAPGWVDTHSHMDGQASWDAYCSPANHHGITTLVMGNCGVGFAPCKPDAKSHQELIEVMEDVEDIPGAALDEGISWDWESFPEYLDALDKFPRAIDIAAQVPHCAIRTYVMGQRGIDNEDATAEDVAQMAALVKEGIEAGAVGFTTSRTELHMTRHGAVMPGTFSTEEELLGIGKVIGELGTGIYGMNSDWYNWEEELDWMKRLSIENQCTLNFVLFYQNEEAWARVQEIFKYVEKANAEGAKLVAHVGVRPVNVLMSYHGTVHPFFLHQNFGPLMALTPEERIEKLRDPELKAKILAEPTPSMGNEVADRMVTDFDTMYELGEDPNYEPDPSESIANKAKAAGVSPQEYAYDALLKRDGKAMLYFPFMGYGNGDLSRQLSMIRHKDAVLSLADTGAHCGVLSDVSIPTYWLSYFTRDRDRGERVPVEEAVKLHTHDTARCVGLEDRGTLELGMKADINVIDYENLRMLAPEVRYDLPAGGRRIFQGAEGYKYTIVSGEVIMRDGVETEAMPGKLIRGTQKPSQAGAAG